MQEFLREMAVNNRQRLVASVMGEFEREVLPHLPTPVRSRATRQLRQKLQAAVGQYHDFVLDAMRAMDATGGESVVVNEEALVLLQQIHQRVTTHG